MSVVNLLSPLQFIMLLMVFILILLVILVMMWRDKAKNRYIVQKAIDYEKKTKDSYDQIFRAMDNLIDERRKMIINVENQLNGQIKSLIDIYKDNEKRAVNAMNNFEGNGHNDTNADTGKTSTTSRDTASRMIKEAIQLHQKKDQKE